nr:mucin-12-like isoform X5 [Paramormyrops kingsleyae]
MHRWTLSGIQKSSLTAQAKPKSAGPSKAETSTAAATAKPISSTTGPEAAESTSESDSEDGLPPTQIAVVTSVTAGLAGAVTRTPAVEREAESSQTGSSAAEAGLQEPANTPRGTPARRPITKMNPAVPVKDSLCTPLLPEATAWPPAEGGARTSDAGSSAGSASEGPATLQVYISQPSATPEVTGIGETSDSDRGNADAREDAAVQKTLVAPKAKPLPAAPKAAVRSTSPPLEQHPSSNPGPSRAPAEAAGGNSESQSEDGLPLTQEAPLTPNPQPVDLTSSSSASSSSISTQKSSAFTKKEERGSADSSGGEDGAKAESARPLRTSKPTATLAGATRSTPAAGRGPGCWDTESSAESGPKDRSAQQTVTAASKVRSKRTLTTRTRNLLQIIDRICGGPVSSGRNETLLAVSPKVSSSKSKSRLTKDEEGTACVTVKGLSAGCSPTSGEPPMFRTSKDLTCAVATNLEDSGTAEEEPSQSLLDSKEAPVKSGEKRKRKGRKQTTFPAEKQKSGGMSLPSPPNAAACEAAKTTTIGKDISLEDSKRLQASEVAPPTEREAICTLKTSTGETKRKRRADKMDPPAKKKKKKRARCSEVAPEGRGGGAKSDRSRDVEKQKETWALILSDSDTSKEHPMASVNTAPTIITLSGEKKWRRMNKKKKKVKVEDAENGMSESTWKMEKVTPGKAKRDYPSEASQELVTVSRKIVRKSSSLKRALFTLDTTSQSSKKRKKSDEGVASKPGPGNKTKVLKKKVKKDKQAEAGRKGAKTAGSCEPVTPAGSLSALLGVKRREKNQIKQKNRKRKKMKATPYRFLLDTLSPMRTSPEPD